MHTPHPVQYATVSGAGALWVRYQKGASTHDYRQLSDRVHDIYYGAPNDCEFAYVKKTVLLAQ